MSVRMFTLLCPVRVILFSSFAVTLLSLSHTLYDCSSFAPLNSLIFLSPSFLTSTSTIFLSHPPLFLPILSLSSSFSRSSGADDQQSNSGTEPHTTALHCTALTPLHSHHFTALTPLHYTALNALTLLYYSLPYLTIPSL